MIYYISDNLQRALDDTGLDEDELYVIVGKFAKHSSRAGLYRGKVVIKEDLIQIRKCFGNKLLWELEDENLRNK